MKDENIEYPEIYHIPSSPGRSEDDGVMDSLSGFNGRRVIVSEKLDGEVITIYTDHFHAQVGDEEVVAALWESIKDKIPRGWRVTGICLPDRFAGISVWNDQNVALSWDSTLEWFSLLGIDPVPVLYDGMFDEAVIDEIIENLDADKAGIVIRVAEIIPAEEFPTVVGKWVLDDG